jgi:hypothetical protein
MWRWLLERNKVLRINPHTGVAPNSTFNKDWMIKMWDNLMMETVHPLEITCGFKPETVKISKISVMELDLFYLRYLLDDNSNKIIT